MGGGKWIWVQTYRPDLAPLLLLLIEAEGSVAANTNSKGEEKFSVKEYVLVSCLYY